VEMNVSILGFIAIAYLLSIVLGLIVGVTGGHESPLIGFGVLSMFFPAIAALVVHLWLNEGLRIDWRRLPANYIPIALVLMPVVIHAAMLPVTIALEGGLP
jgi:hypothetical protein